MIKFSMNKKYGTVSTAIYAGFKSQPSTIIAFPTVPSDKYDDPFVSIKINDVKITRNVLIKGYRCD